MGWLELLVLVRHAESEGNVRSVDERAKYSVSTHEYALTARGREQAHITGEFLRKREGGFHVYYTSYYKRSKETMQIMFPGARIYEEPRLAEGQRGIWHTMTKAQIKKRYPGELERKERDGLYHYRPIGGENWPDIELRIHSFLGTLSRDCEDQKVIAVVHGHWQILFQRLIHHFSIAEALDRYHNHTAENASVTMYRGEKLNGKSHLRLMMENKATASSLHWYINRRIAIIKFGAEKRAEMASMKYRLKQIDSGQDYEESEKGKRRNIFYEAENMVVRREGEEEKKITMGDIAGDYLWGIKYSAGKSLPPPLWRRVSKFIALKDARANIENIFNSELSEVEGVNLPTSSWTYEFIEKHSEEGVLAERMAQGILLRMQYDNRDLGVRVEPSNALEDAELKYDFKIILPRKKRGVAMEGEELPRPEYEEKKRKLGIQFTVSQNRKYLKHKRLQLEKAKGEIGLEKYRNIIKKPVDDIVLVSVPLKRYSECFKKWLEAGRPSGGPEQYLTGEEREKLVSAIISGPATA